MQGKEWALLRYPWILKWVWGQGTSIARAIYPFIFLPDDLYERVMTSGKKDPDAFAVLVHERAHLKRVEATFLILGPLIFGFRFLIGDKKFILSEELYAIGEEMKYRKTMGVAYNIERKARQFDSPLYGNLLSYEKATEILTKLWESTDQNGA